LSSLAIKAIERLSTGRGGKRKKNWKTKGKKAKTEGGTRGNWTRKPEAKKSKAGGRKKGITERGKGRK